MFRKIVNFTLLLILGCFFTLPVGAQTKMENIKDDIRIMESILEQLLESSRNYSFNGHNIKGFYFDDYGLLFNVNMENSFHIYSFGIAGKNNINILNKKLLEVEEKAKAKKDRDRKGVVASSGKMYRQFGLGMDEADFEEWEKKLDKKTANRVEWEYLKCIENFDFKSKNYHHALEDITNAEQILNTKNIT